MHQRFESFWWCNNHEIEYAKKIGFCLLWITNKWDTILKILDGESFTKWLVWGARTWEIGKLESFCIPTAYKCINFKISKFILPSSSVWVSPTTSHCQHHWSGIPFWAKWQFVGPHHLPKFLGKKPKATTNKCFHLVFIGNNNFNINENAFFHYVSINVSIMLWLRYWKNISFFLLTITQSPAICIN